MGSSPLRLFAYDTVEKRKKTGDEWELGGGGGRKLALASSNLLLCIISSQFAACPRFVCYTKERE